MEYNCGICGKKHAGLDSYARCVVACSLNKKREEEDRRASELKAVQQQRKEDLIKMRNEYFDAYRKYHADYGLDPAFGEIVWGFPDSLTRKLRDALSPTGW